MRIALARKQLLELERSAREQFRSEGAEPGLTPPVDELLVEWLRFKFPPQRPKPGETQDDIMFEAGRQSVIEFLQAQIDQDV